MFHVPSLKKQIIVFRQWTRKSYAVFSSLGREIVIGHLLKGISDASLCKLTSNLHTSCICQNEESLDKDDLFDEEESTMGLLVEFLMVFILSTYALTASLSLGKRYLYKTLKLSSKVL